ncbi:MAG: ribonuclease E/G, partial [Limnobacter sp.]|nr:ribonuclease E/G [Limnobacter sp.]
WEAIDSAGQSTNGAFLIYQESSLVIRAIRDYFHKDIGEVLIDTDDIYEQAKQFMQHVMPDLMHVVKRYSDDIPLFSRFQIEHQIETAYSRMVPLPSGGAIVIDHTEALVSIDVNSARATRGADIEDTAFRTNLEAAEEAARQLRLRDLGGLIVIDFIDMEKASNQKEVEKRVKESLYLDRARVQMDKISRFGLLELSRQRIRPALNEGSHTTCPRCNGTGVIRDTESAALHILRIVQEEAMKEGTASIRTQVPVDVATFLLNEKRSEIHKLEARFKVSILLIPNKHLETPHYEITRLRHDDERLDDTKPSFELATVEVDQGYYARKVEAEAARTKQEAVIKGVIPPNRPAPPAPKAAAQESSAEKSLWNKIFDWFKREPEEEVKPEPDHKNRGQRGRGGRGRGAADGEERQGRGRSRNRRGSEGRQTADAASADGKSTEGKTVAAAPEEQSSQGRSGEGNSRRRGGQSTRQGRDGRRDSRGEPKDSSPLAGSDTQQAAVAPADNARPSRNSRNHQASSNEAGLGDTSLTEGSQEANGEEGNDHARRGRRRRRGSRRPEEGQSLQTPEQGKSELVSEGDQNDDLADKIAKTMSYGEPDSGSNHNAAEFSNDEQGQKRHRRGGRGARGGRSSGARGNEDRDQQENQFEQTEQVEQAQPQQPSLWDTPAVNGYASAALPVAEPQAPQAVALEQSAQGNESPVQADHFSQENLSKMVEEVGMLWVETDREKWATVQDVLCNQPAPAKVQRHRKPAPAMVTDNLVLIETKTEYTQRNATA